MAFSHYAQASRLGNGTFVLWAELGQAKDASPGATGLQTFRCLCELNIW